MSTSLPGPAPEWSDSPTGPTLRKVPVIKPGPGQSVYAFAVCPKVEGCYLHFLNGRTTPCLGEQADCEGCRKVGPGHWYGFLGAWLHKMEEYCILQITEGCWRLSPGFKDFQGTFRGKAIELHRAARKQRGLVLAKVHDSAYKGELPPAFDVREVLLRLWYAPNRGGKGGV